MGVINLGILVEKIKRKLLSAGFITSSDKASKSKFGIVKIGPGINVSSGVISVPVSGGTVSLYHYESGEQTVNTDIALTTPVPDGTKAVLFLLKTATYPWLTGFGIVDVLLPLEEAHTGWTTSAVGYTGVGTVLLKKSKDAFQKTGSSDIVADIIAIL